MINLIDLECGKCRALRENNNKGNIFCMDHRYKLFTDAMDEIKMMLDKKIKELDYGWDYHSWEKKRAKSEVEFIKKSKVRG